MKRKYELTVVLSPQLNAKDLKAAIAGVEKLVEKVKGKVLKKDDWGKKELAYPIKKETGGMYVLLGLELPAESAAKMDKELRLMDEVVRFLLVTGD